MILRFRDLSSAVGDTIRLHREKIDQHGYAWWGWWAKPEEKIPRDVFAHFTDLIRRAGTHSLEVYLLDSGERLLYRASIVRIETSPGSDLIDTPEQDKTPNYYVAKTCKTWFKIDSIRDCDTSELSRLSYDEVPGIVDDPTSPAFGNGSGNRKR